MKAWNGNEKSKNKFLGHNCSTSIIFSIKKKKIFNKESFFFFIQIAVINSSIQKLAFQSD